jgi:hypothetical protein
MSNQKKTTSIRRGGPRTVEGKRRSSRNARKHALLTTELNLSTEERAAFKDLRKGLLQELMPNTPILLLLFEIVVADAWRMKLALRGEQRAVKKQLDSRDDPQPLSAKVRMDFPYVLSTSELRPRLELIENTLIDFAQTGSLNPDLEDPFTRAFGIEFWKTLIAWQPLDTMMVRLLEAGLEKQKAFAMKPLEDPPTAEQERTYIEYDTKSRHEMVLKLMDMKKDELQLAIHRLGTTKAGGRSILEEVDRLDLYLRYQTAARREFYRALHEYREAKAESNQKTA